MTKRALFVGAFVSVAVVLLILAAIVLPDALAKLFLGKSEEASFPFTIHVFMWLIFFGAVGELAYRLYVLRQEKSALTSSYLPQEDNRVLTVDDMPDIYRNVKSLKSELAELVGSLALRFQAGKSVEQTHQLLSSQLELWQYRLDVDYTVVRYISWLIPTIGFLGTVVGISKALTFAGSGAVDPTSDAFLPAVTSQLGLAFDTTMLALMMSVVLVFLMQWIQSREEILIEKSGRYCLDNLITRLYIGT